MIPVRVNLYLQESVFVFPSQQLPPKCVTYNSASLFRLLLTACEDNPDHPISHCSLSRWRSTRVMDSVFRRPNNSLFLDEALFSGAVVVLVQSLCGPGLQQEQQFLLVRKTLQ